MRKLLVSVLFLVSFIYAEELDSIVVTAKSQSLAVDTAGSFSIITKVEMN